MTCARHREIVEKVFEPRNREMNEVNLVSMVGSGHVAPRF